jgi:hypothetical protein
MSTTNASLDPHQIGDTIKAMMEYNIESSNLISSTSIMPINMTIINEEEMERLFHT